MPSNHDTAVHEVFRFRVESGAEHSPNGELARYGPITVASHGGAHRLANSALIFEPPDSDELAEAVEWMAARDVPFFVWVSDGALDTVEISADEFGLRKSGVVPGMVLPSLDDRSTIEVDATITEVTTADDGEEFWSVFRSAFDMPQDEQIRRMIVDSAVDERCRSYVGRVNGQAVATGAVLEKGAIANVWGMATLEEFRGRGIATAICREALRTANEDGCHTATLESAPMAVSLYEDIGFEPVVNYHLFELDP